jgi:hypothetical protein
LLKSSADLPRCQIVIRADSTFEASVPDYVVGLPPEWSGRRPSGPPSPYWAYSGDVLVGRGRWSLTGAPGDASIKLEFRELDGKACEHMTSGLMLEASGDSLRLFVWVGEIGSDRFAFERTDEDRHPPEAGR